MTTIAFVRHGITDWNYERRAQGQSDIPLNGEGRQQAITLAVRMQTEKWDLIFSSDLSRAKETADIVADMLEMSVVTDQRLREMHKGETEGTTLEERVSRWGSQWESQSLGIESDELVMNRGTSFVTDIAKAYHGQRIIIVSHGALIGLTIKQLIPQLNIDVHFNNTSVTTLNFNGTEWDCELFNCAKHLRT
ncbi:histidine phosphatase family protein [Paenibacillus albus]|uniref:Histidine phosphatase family protein n=1 Tax=Paenibacillus albus TaxID=2495582 RepID=A0A3Q8X834_9BACL|nr:histidine phosphatase family protein [Paenibacillus albus]AZN41034.1 histidine phosphatase family protein [Paenibacillus albus]